MTSPSSSDEDALLDSLDNDTDPTLTHLRESRLQQLSHSLKQSAQQRRDGFGTYTILTTEQALLDLTTSVAKCIVHFCKSDFNRCRIMDAHLAALAPAHLSTRFVKMDVEHAPFLVTKLKVRVLPCVIAFIDGVGVDRIVGFEGLGRHGDGADTDTFKTGDLETRLVRIGVLEREEGVEGVGENIKKSSITAREKDNDNDDDDDDDEWD